MVAAAPTTGTAHSNPSSTAAFTLALRASSASGDLSSSIRVAVDLLFARALTAIDQEHCLPWITKT